jgi:hypothetical protein
MEKVRHGTENRIVAGRTTEQLKKQRNFKGPTTKEMWLWVAQRLEISTKIKINIEKAYKTV